MAKKMKSRASDYTENDFPLSRKDVFLEAYRERFSLLLRLGLLALVFAIPHLLLSFWRDYAVAATYAKATEQTAETYAKIATETSVVYGLGYLITLPLAAFLFAGILQVLRQLLWNVPVFLGDDWKQGVKENGWRLALSAFAFALLYYELNFIAGTYLEYAIRALVLLLFAPWALWLLSEHYYYELKFGESLKNAVLFYVRTVPFTLLFVFLAIIPFWACDRFLSYLGVKQLVEGVLLLFYLVPWAMAWLLYACHVFDRYINRDYYPEYYRKGMRKIEDSSTENRPR